MPYVRVADFLSFTVFLALNSKEFCNAYLRDSPGEAGLFSLGDFMGFWGWVFLASTVVVFFVKKDEHEKGAGIVVRAETPTLARACTSIAHCARLAQGGAAAAQAVGYPTPKAVRFALRPCGAPRGASRRRECPRGLHSARVP